MSAGMREYSCTIAGAGKADSERAREVASIFGLDPASESRTIIRRAQVPEGGVTYVTGFSGSGKSTLLRLVRDACPGAATLAPLPERDCAVVDLFAYPLGETIYWLSKFGLGEAHLLRAQAADLSEGQKYRLALALLIAAKPRAAVVDEFLSVLDRVTAKMVAHNLQKLCREHGITLYVATAHEDLIESLEPDYIVRMDLDGRSETLPGPRGGVADSFLHKQKFAAQDGTLRDLDELSRYHYRASSEDSLERAGLLRQVRVVRHEGRLAAVRVFTSPFAKELEKFSLFKTLNERVWVSERVIVHPAYRGVGLTRLLEPQLPRGCRLIFAQSALGLYYPFNLKSGFMKIEHPNNAATDAQLQLHARITARLAGSPNGGANPHSAAVLQALLDAVEPSEREALKALAARAYADKNLAWVAFLADAAGVALSAGDRSRLDSFFIGLSRALPESRCGMIMEAALPFPMQGFIRRIERES